MNITLFLSWMWCEWLRNLRFRILRFSFSLSAFYTYPFVNRTVIVPLRALSKRKRAETRPVKSEGNLHSNAISIECL